MKPILFDPDRHSDRIQCTADCPAAIVSEICGQLSAGVTDLDTLAESIYSGDGDSCEDWDDAEFIVRSVLNMLTALGFLEFSSTNPGSGYRVIRPMSVGESFTDYFEDKYSEEEIDD